MRGDVAEADRRHEVRTAARAWQRAGAIDETTRETVDAAHPDDRHRLGPVFRVLVFGFTVVVLQATLGIVGLMVAEAGKGAGSVFFLLLGFGLAGLTEIQQGQWRRRQGGTEAATAFLAVVLVIGASSSLLFQVVKPGDDVSINAVLLLTTLVLAATGYRWGYALFGGLSAITLFVLLGRSGLGRLLWAVVPLVAAPLLLRAGESGSLPPSHRRSCHAAAVVALVFLYLAVHLGSWDIRLVELLSEGWDTRGERPFRAFFVLATAAVPLGTIAWGLFSRRRLLVNVGLAGALASLVTIRFYSEVAPLWVVLTAGGALAIGVVLILRRFLDAGPGHARGGYTAEALFTDPEARSVVEVAASVAAFTPAARPVEPAGFQGGGGRSGGAGASGTF